MPKTPQDLHSSVSGAYVGKDFAVIKMKVANPPKAENQMDSLQRSDSTEPFEEVDDSYRKVRLTTKLGYRDTLTTRGSRGIRTPTRQNRFLSG